MPAAAPSKGLQVSINFTPQAKDDLFTVGEDAAGHTTLDVLANDGGGNAAKVMGLYTGAQAANASMASATPVTTALTAMGATVKINADGTIDYNSGTIFQHLPAGVHATDTFTYVIRMANGAFSVAVATVDIVGENDVPTITGVHCGSVAEDGTLSSTGTLVVTDIDTGESHTQVIANQAGNYGSFSVDANGHWSYNLDNAAAQSLAAGQTVTETFTVSSADGSAHQDVTIKVSGAEDPVTIVAAGTDASGAVTEDSATPNLTDTGIIAFNDVDLIDTHTATVVADSGNTLGGVVTLGAAVEAANTSGGTIGWTYTVDNAATQHLGAGVTATEKFTVTISDGHSGTVDQVVTVVVTGVNDEATFTGDDTGNVTEDTALTASGILTAHDVDDGESSIQAGTIAGSHGSLAIDSAGAWTYTVNNADVQHLGAGDSITDTVTVLSLDGTTHDITITIYGTNDPATFTGDISGTVTEDTALTASGTVTAHDVDDGQSSMQAGNANGSHGSLTIDADGNWTYTVDNANVQHLGAGASITDTVTVHSADGTAQNITITIHGTNDAALIAGNDAGSVTEEGPLSVGGALTVNDADDGESTFAAGSYGGLYGALVLLAGGGWTYNLDNANAAVQALNTGDHLTDTITVHSADGTTHDVTITINGLNDAVPYTPPAVYTGGGDPNDFDGNGLIGNQNIVGNGTQTVMYGGPGDDHINGVPGNDGDETIYGGSGNDGLDGKNGNDTIYGGSGNDTLVGANGTDVLVGGYGADTLTGSGGDDVFKYLDAKDTGDTITDFTTGSDTFNFSGVGVTHSDGLVTTAGQVSAHGVSYMYDTPGTTIVYVDTDGVAGADLEIHLSNGHIALTHADLGVL